MTNFFQNDNVVLSFTEQIRTQMKFPPQHLVA